MPPISLRTQSRSPFWIGALLVLLCVFTVTAGAASKQWRPAPSPVGTGSGLAAVYVDSTGASVSRVDATVNFNWGLGSPAPSLAADNFSARWTGDLQPRYTETYKLALVSDDGVRLWLDGQLLIDAWTEHSKREDSVFIALTAGRRYDLKIEYFEKMGAAVAQLFWSSASQARQIVPQTQLYPTAPPAPPPANTQPTVSLTSPAAGSTYAAPATVPLAASASDADGTVTRVEFLANGTLVGTDTTAPYAYSWSNVAAGSYNLVARATDDDGAVSSSKGVAVTVNTPQPAPNGNGTGLSGQYFDGPNFTGQTMTRVDPTVDFTWGLGSPAATMNPDHYSVRWTGELQPRFSETYTLSTITDDGVRLWVDGQLVIDRWTEQSATESSVLMPLKAGQKYAVKLEYFEQGGAATARFLWSSISQSKQVVPKTQLYPAAAPAPPPVNAPPSVALTGPAAGSSYAAPAIVPLSATASDSDGSISRVEFFANGTLVGTDTTTPYEFSWTGVAAGSYSLTARATDDDGAGAVSAPRTITVTAPPTPPAGSGTGLLAQYFDSNDLSGTPTSRVDAKVDFTWGTGSPAAPVGSDDFSVRWAGQLEARFTETYTLSTVSDDGVRMWVDGKLVIDNWNEHPATEDFATLALVSGRRYDVKIEYFELGGAATARLLWSAASQPKQAVPQSQLYPSTATSPTNAPPTVSLTSPTAGASFAAPVTISLAASAADSDGSVNRVEFFAGSTLVGTDTTSPYGVNWSGMPAAGYTLTARATDDDGASTVSQPVAITVTGGSAPPPPPPPPPPAPPGGGVASVFVSPSGSDAGSCSQAAPCASFQRAYAVAAPGQVVEVAGGTYPSQNIRAVAGKSAPNVVFRPAAGARVILGGLSFGNGDMSGGPDFITVRDMETTYKGTAPGAGNQRGVHVGPGSSYITLENLDAGSVGSWFADHMTVRGGDFGPCLAVSSGNVCGNNMQDMASDLLIEGAYFHDMEYDPSAPDAHWECMYINGGRNVTIRGNRYERCAIFDLFVTISGPDAGKIGHENLRIENNYFGPATNGFGVTSRDWSSLSISWCQNAPQPAYRNVLIQGNNFANGKAGIQRDLNADGAGCKWSNVLVKGNTLMWQGCQNGWVYEDNIFHGGTGCGPTNTKGG